MGKKVKIIAFCQEERGEEWKLEVGKKNAASLKGDDWEKFWLDALMKATAEQLEEQVKAAADADVIVAALPEYYWQDGAGFQGKEPEPFDRQTVARLLDVDPEDLKKPKTDGRPEGNTLRSLTEKYKNLILFAGTLWWVSEDSSQPGGQLSCNSLPVFYGGNCAFLCTKKNAAGIGSYLDIDFITGDPVITDSQGRTYKKEEVCDTNGNPRPLVEFQGIKFGLDICFDFVLGMSDEDEMPTQALSKELLPAAPDIHVLIAGGMPVRQDGYETFVNAKSLFVRCDACSYGGEDGCGAAFEVGEDDGEVNLKALSNTSRDSLWYVAEAGL